MEHLQVGEQTYVYRRGNTVVALNNDTKPAEVRVPASAFAAGALPADALGACPALRRAGDAVTIALPARAGCVF
jgi:hypothetical protein